MTSTLRSLPRTLLWASVTLAVLAATVLSPATALADDGTAGVSPADIDELIGDDAGDGDDLAQRIEQAVAAAEEALAEAAAEVEDLTAQRRELEGELEEAESRVEHAEAALASAGAELDAVTTELEQRRSDHRRERELLRGEVRESWKETTGGTPVAITGTIGIMDVAGTGREVLRQLDVLRYVLDQRADEVKTLEELTEEAAALRDALTELRGRRTDDVAAARTARDDVAAAAERVRVLEDQAAQTAAARSALLQALRQRGELELAESAEIAAALDALDGVLVSTGRGLAPAELAAYGNGRVPGDALVEIGVGGHRLWGPAATAFKKLRAAAAEDGIRIDVTDSYRSYELQVDVARRKGLYSEGGLAARPGTSNHGWGLAVDLDLDDAALSWMRRHAGRFGFVEDTPREPWHWVFTPEEAR